MERLTQSVKDGGARISCTVAPSGRQSRAYTWAALDPSRNRVLVCSLLLWALPSAFSGYSIARQILSTAICLLVNFSTGLTSGRVFQIAHSRFNGHVPAIV